jgi:membrane-associated phospholipid phosphatase
MQFGRAWDIFALNLLIIALIPASALLHRRFPRQWIQFLRDWYVMPLLIILYMENRRLVPLINPHDMDSLLISIDRFLFFGHDPTILLEGITSPFLSEILQASYATFYFLPASLCVILYLRGPRMDFHINASTILMGFYLSYIGYYFTPAIGPRFTLDHLQTFSLSGVFLFDFIRDMLARAEGLMRDCCPSGHAMISLLTVGLARRYVRRFFPIACIWASLIVFSTVYLRYHYVIDLIAGLFLGLVVYRYGPGIAESLIVRNRCSTEDAGVIACGQEDS